MTGFATKPLSTFVKLASGGTPSKGNPEYWGGDIPWLTPKDMSRFDETTQNAVTEKAIGNGTKRAPIGSLFIAVRGMSLHKEIRIVRPDRQMTFNQDIKAITPTNAIGPQFLFYAMLAQIPDLLGAVESAGHGTGVLPTDKLNALPIPELPLPEQRAIAATLGALDDKIELNRRMNETLEAMARALFRDWFVDFGPTRAKMAQSATESGIGAKPQTDPTAPYLSPALWSLFPDHLDDAGKPEGWEETTIGSVLERLKVGKLYDKKSALDTGIVPILDQGKSGEIGFHNNEPNIRACAEDRVCTFANHTCVLRLVDFDFSTIQNVIPFRGKNYPTEWVYFVSQGRQKFEEYRGHWPSFIEHTITAPPLKLAGAFRDKVAPMIALMSQNEQESRTLAQTRDLLLPRLMSGELRVAEAARAVEEVL